LYKLQICNVQTHEVLREKTFKKPDLISSLIELGLKGKECFLFDEECRTYKGKYVNHYSFIEGDTITYKVFFELRLSEIQARVARYV